MIAVLQVSPGGAILGWFLAMDVHEARRIAESLGHRGLATWFYRQEFPEPGRHLFEDYTILIDRRG